MTIMAPGSKALGQQLIAHIQIHKYELEKAHLEWPSPKAYPQWRTASYKATPRSPSQIIQPAGYPVFRYVSL